MRHLSNDVERMTCLGYFKHGDILQAKDFRMDQGLPTESCLCDQVGNWPWPLSPVSGGDTCSQTRCGESRGCCKRVRGKESCLYGLHFSGSVSGFTGFVCGLPCDLPERLTLSASEK